MPPGRGSAAGQNFLAPPYYPIFTRLRFAHDLWCFTNVLWLIDWLQPVHSVCDSLSAFSFLTFWGPAYPPSCTDWRNTSDSHADPRGTWPCQISCKSAQWVASVGQKCCFSAYWVKTTLAVCHFAAILPVKTYKHHIFAPTAGVHSLISPNVVEDVELILKGVNHFLIQHIVFPTGCKILIFDHWLKTIPAVCHSAASWLY